MADSIILSDGTNDFEFVYDAQTQNDFKVHYGVKIEAGEPEPTWHTPDSAPPSLIRLRNNNRTIFLTKNVYGDNWDDVINTLVPIKRLIDGEDQQAARYHTDGDVDKVYLRIQLDGMTRYTDATVIYGFVDDSGSYYTPPAILNKQALGVVVMLVVEPLGEGAPITLRNDLASSPHFLQDSNADGLSDGWDATATAATYAINTSTYLTGGKCQQVNIVSAASTRGIQSAAVTASTSTQAVAYIWIRTTVGSDRVYVVLRDGSNNDIQAKSFRALDADGVSDKTAVDSAGNTWYRVVVSGTNTTAANFRLWVVRNSTDASVGTIAYLDNAYLQTGTTTAPDAWCSTSAIQNRYDPTSTSAATQARINYLDVWGVPGDSNAALLVDTVANSLTDAQMMTVGMRSDTKQFAGKLTHWVDSSEFTVSLTDWSTTNDANRYGGSYIGCLSTAGAPNSIASLDAGNAPELYSRPVKVYAIMRTNNANAELSIKFGVTNAIIKTLGPVKPAAINTWSIVDCGVLDMRGMIPPETIYTNSMTMTVTAGGTAGTVYVDAVLLMPTEQIIVTQYEDENSFSTGATKIVDGIRQTFWANTSTTSQIRAFPYSGSLWHVRPSVSNRLIFFWHGDKTAGSKEEHEVTRTAEIELQVIPRTRHLLGTV